ncbi:MAG: nodulation protein NfeD [Desulfobacterales bacterium]|nr:nodulation protein NfeD [Desulfobacterales bacterium]MBF0395982.1 nodulation protein NfeD [Desulfobacterales bacterium]
MKKNLLFLLVIFFYFGISSASCEEIYLMKVQDSINPGVADYLKTGIKKASEDKVSCVIIELDTPGGLLESMRTIVKAIIECRVPVVVYVSPSGARAASAGVMITMAADIAVMAPGTNIGAAHPVTVGGEKTDNTVNKKIINDMVANAQSIAEKRGRNKEWVEQAIRESSSITEGEAIKKGVIDFIAKDINDLIKQINGREIKDKGVIKITNPNIVILKENIRTIILKVIADPNIAYILMMIGLAGLYFELSTPGAVFPGVIGGISLILAFFAFQTLPINYAGVLLIILAMIFFIMELIIASYALLSIAGVISLCLGSLMLFGNGDEGVHISIALILSTVIIFSLFFLGILSLVIKAQISRPKTGDAGLADEIGIVKKMINLEGKVFVHGELWNAVSKTPIDEGMKVKILKVDNLVLEVEPIEPLK